MIKPQQKSLEQYEDALLDLMMETALDEEGHSALNMQSNGESFVVVPTDLTNQNIDLINHSFTRKKRKAIRKQVVFALMYAFLGIVISVSLFAAAFKCIPEVREFVYNSIVEYFEGETKKKVGEILGFKMSTSPEIAVHWIPEGYTLYDSGTSDSFMWVSYKNSDNNEIVIDVYRISNGVLSLDTEDAEIKNIEINGFPTMAISKETDAQVALMNDVTHEVCVIYSDHAPVEDLIKVAEGIEFK